MITNLNIVDPGVIPGNQIDAVEMRVRNLRIHKIVQNLARCLMFCLECDSNNTSSKVRPRDVRAIRAQFDLAVSEIEFAEAHNDFPQAPTEFGFLVYLIDQKEIQYVKNVKLYHIVSEIYNTCKIILGCDSANTQGFIASEDFADIKEMMQLCNDSMDRYIGRGTDANDTGLTIPAYEILGEINPPVNGNYSEEYEPSSGRPVPTIPDVGDIPKVTAGSGGVSGKSLTAKSLKK